MVGPRPERPEFVKALSEQIPYYRQRHCVRPGITGWAQINYKYGDTLEDTITKLEYDLYYIKNMSLTPGHLHHLPHPEGHAVVARRAIAHTDHCGTVAAIIVIMANPSLSPEVETMEREQLVPLYRVVLLDDNDHTYDYVIEMLQKIFIFTLDQAYRHAEEVDRAGRTVLITCELREAEYARDQIHAYGPDWRLPRSKGSMRAIVEPAA